MERDVNTSTTEASSADLNTNPADVSNVGRAYHRKRNCKIIVDSPADFAPAVAKRLGVRVIPFSYVTPEGEFVDDFWESKDPHEFYEFMRKNPDVRITTTAVTPLCRNRDCYFRPIHYYFSFLLLIPLRSGILFCSPSFPVFFDLCFLRCFFEPRKPVQLFPQFFRVILKFRPFLIGDKTKPISAPPETPAKNESKAISATVDFFILFTTNDPSKTSILSGHQNPKP